MCREMTGRWIARVFQLVFSILANVKRKWNFVFSFYLVKKLFDFELMVVSSHRYFFSRWNSILNLRANAYMILRAVVFIWLRELSNARMILRAVVFIWLRELPNAWMILRAVVFIWLRELLNAWMILRAVYKKVKSSMARSLPGKNLLPQNVGSIINYLQ